MQTTIDKAGRVVIPAAIRLKAGFQPGTRLEVVADDFSVRLIKTGPGARIVNTGKRLVARPSASPEELPAVDVAELVAEERNRWPW
jgi:AbrB family looped-hinge helix DNA binding protein